MSCDKTLCTAMGSIDISSAAPGHVDAPRPAKTGASAERENIVLIMHKTTRTETMSPPSESSIKYRTYESCDVSPLPAVDSAIRLARSWSGWGCKFRSAPCRRKVNAGSATLSIRCQNEYFCIIYAVAFICCADNKVHKTDTHTHKHKKRRNSLRKCHCSA